MSKQSRTPFTLLLLLAWLLALSGGGHAESLPMRAYTTADGLPYNRISRIVKDSRGFLWFCTGDGLSRFDGLRFTNYNIEDGLPSTSINDLVETRDGAYWVATNGGGVALMNSTAGTRPVNQSEARARFTTYLTSNNAVTNRVNVLFEDSSGTLWAGTDGGLFRLDDKDGERGFHSVELHIPAHPDLSVQVWAFVEDVDKGLWVATKFGLVHRLRDGRMIHYEIRPGQTDDVVSSLLKDDEGNLWLSHDSEVVVFKPQSDPESRAASGQTLRLPGDARRYSTAAGQGDIHVRALFRSSSGRIWASDTAPGVSVFDGKAFQPYPLKEFLDSPATIAEDRDGNLWLSSTAKGALRLAMDGLISYGTGDGLGPVVGSIFEGPAGQLFVSSSKWLISRFDDGRFSSVKLNLPRSVTNTDWRATDNILVDRTGEWWVGTRVGLYRFGKVSRFEQLATLRPKAVYTRKDGLADDDVTHLFEDAHGDLWIAGFLTGREVLTRWERTTESFQRYSEADGLPPFTRVNAFCEDAAGTLWVAFDQGGLAHYGGGRFAMLTEDEGVPAGTIRDLYQDRSGRLWFTHPKVGALYRIDQTGAAQLSLSTYTRDDGLYTHRLSLITEDGAGRIYVGNSRGIDQLDPATRHIKHYTSSGGLSTGELLSAFHDRRSNLWFSTTNGLLLRLPPRPERDLAPPNILIGELRIAGNPYRVSELGEKEIAGLEMEPNQNQMQVDFFGLSSGSDESLRYQFKLEGAHSDWSAPTEQRSVNYANLAAGSYRFLVRAINANGAASESPAIVAFKVLPPVWKRWWFLALAALLFAFVSFAFGRSRLARVRAERESDRRFRTLAETASDAIITIDEDSHIVLTNQATAKIFGYSIAEMLGKDLTMLMPEYLRHLHHQGLSRYKDTGVRHTSWQAIELPGLHKDGREIPLEISFGEFIKNDRRYFTGIARDITERKRAEAEHKRAEEALRRSREERLAEMERVRRRIATDLHDDIGSSLTRISLLSEVVQRQIGGVAAPVTEPLSSIARLSRELVDSMSDIVWAINPQKDHLSDLSQRMRRFASDLFTARGITFRLHVPDAEHDIKVGANIRRELFLVFKEAVNNLVRHSACTQADIEFRAEAERLYLRLSDNGRGFEVPQKSNGHGLASMSERTAGLGGKLEIVSRAGAGTTLIFTIPLPQQEPRPSALAAASDGSGKIESHYLHEQ
jgi:PAS domain S-box-containing protein